MWAQMAQRLRGVWVRMWCPLALHHTIGWPGVLAPRYLDLASARHRHCHASEATCLLPAPAPAGWPGAAGPQAQSHEGGCAPERGCGASFPPPQSAPSCRIPTLLSVSLSPVRVSESPEVEMGIDLSYPQGRGQVCCLQHRTKFSGCICQWEA